MSATGYTPILIYGSTTTGNTPSASNLTTTTNGVELAINATDGKLFYKDNNGVVQVLATKGASQNSISFGTTGLTPNTLTQGAVTVAGTLITSNGGTGLSSYTAGDLPYYASGTALSKLGIGTNGQILTSSGTAPQWSTLSGVAVTTFQTSLSGLTPSSATSGAITLAGTLGTSSGGTGLTAFTANQIFYASSTSAIAQSSNLTFNGTTLTANTLNLTNALGVAYGGTGLTSLTSGYIPYGNGTSAFGSSANFNYDGTINFALGTSGVFSPSANRANFSINGSSGSIVSFGVGSVRTAYLYSDGTDLSISNDSTGALRFLDNGAERARISSAGYLGIGTSSPSYPLDVLGSQINFRSGSSSTHPVLSVGRTSQELVIGVAAGSSSIIVGDAAGDVDFQATSGAFNWSVNNGATLNMKLDTSGNLGLGVTPSAWIGKTAYQAKIGSFVGDSSATYFSSNWFYGSGGDTYIGNGYASQYVQYGGLHAWKIAPSGIAGNAISFTQALTLDNSGNLLVGTTSQIRSGELVVAGSSSSINQLVLADTNAYNATPIVQQTFTTKYNSSGTYADTAYIRAGKVNATDGNSLGYLSFATNTGSGAVEAMRIDSSGNLLVGTTSAGVGYASQGIILEPAGYESVNHASGTSSGSAYIAFGYNSAGIGSITQNGTTGVLYNITSDQRLKTNIVDAPQGNIDQIKVRSFDWIADGSHQEYGMVAQELLEVAPYAVHQPQDPEEMMGVDYSKLVPMMIKEIQDLKAEVNQLKQKIGV